MKVGEDLVGEDRRKAISDKKQEEAKGKKVLDVFGEHEPFGVAI